MSLKNKKVAPPTGTGRSKISTIKPNTAMINFLQEVTVQGGNLLFDEETVKSLAGIRCTDGEFLLSLDYPQIVYEIIGGFDKLKKLGIKDFEITIDFLKSIAQSKNFSVKNDDISFIFEAPWYEEESKIHRATIDRLKTKISVKKGIFKCPDCLRNKRDATKTETIEFQTRSGDEPLTNFNTCNNCGWKWVI